MTQVLPHFWVSFLSCANWGDSESLTGLSRSPEETNDILAHGPDWQAPSGPTE